jgi:hypothetical protein
MAIDVEMLFVLFSLFYFICFVCLCAWRTFSTITTKGVGVDAEDETKTVKETISFASLAAALAHTWPTMKLRAAKRKIPELCLGALAVDRFRTERNLRWVFRVPISDGFLWLFLNITRRQGLPRYCQQAHE